MRTLVLILLTMTVLETLEIHLQPHQSRNLVQRQVSIRILPGASTLKDVLREF
jgi:hypothetical protein